MAKKEDAIEKQQTGGALANVPDYIKKGSEGIGKMDRGDVLVPRIAIAQNTSDQLKPQNPKYILDLRLGDLFNSLSGEIYPSPLTIHIVRREPTRYVEFNPREAGGGIKDPNVPANDPRTLFGPGGEKPVATKFCDYLVVVGPLNEDTSVESVVALSMKSSQIKVAKALNTELRKSQRPAYSGVYELVTVPEKNAQGEFYNFSLKRVRWATQDEFAGLELLFKTLEGLNVEVQREPGQDDDDEELAGDIR